MHDWYVHGLWAKKKKAAMVGGDAVISCEWWCLSSWEEMCVMCKRRMNSLRG